MRILHIVRQYSPAVGGLEGFVKSLVAEQRQQGLDVEVLTLNRVFHTDALLPDYEIIDGVPVTRIGFKGSYKYPLAFDVRKKIKGFDIVHVHAVDFFIDFLSFIRTSKKQKLILSTHGGFFHTQYASTLKTIFFNTVTRFTLKRVDLVLACSNNDFNVFSKIVPKEKLVLIENGVDTTKFGQSAPVNAEKNFVFIGRFSNNKRVDLLVELFFKLVKKDPSYQLKIIGKDWDGNETKIRAQIEKHGIESNVAVLTGLSDEAIQSSIESSSFIISASEYEGFGLTLIEGMSAGLIPIASKIPSFEKIISQSGQGALIDFGSVDANAFDEQVSSLIKNYGLDRPAIIEFSHRYSWSSVSLTFTQWYKRLIPEAYRVIQGVKVINATKADALALIESKVGEIHAGEAPVKVAFANAHTINIANKDSKVKDVLNRCVVLNDGVGLEIASKLKYGVPFKDNLNGTDFIPYLLGQSKRSYRIFLIGAEQSSVEGCFTIWKGQYPQHEFVGYQNGFYNTNDLPAVVARIADLGADLILVAMGNPKQELWLDEHLSATGAKLGIGVGALFDFTAGKVKRAPEWVRKIKCEWLYRFLQEPKRLFRRYFLGNAWFLKKSIQDISSYR
ncbi:MAG: WecB/TagA/CpsF family glycosyltransferase [Neptunomonas phycophila]